jgi:multidrug efflux pump subunit AcrA (membrane-fusion protein)
MLLVPSSAVTTFGQMERVFVVSANRALLRLVKIGARHGADIEILSGLATGERIVADPAAPLRDGQSVEVKP